MYFPTFAMINKDQASLMDQKGSNKADKGRLRSLKKRAAAKLSGDEDAGQSSSDSSIERGDKPKCAHGVRKGSVFNEGIMASMDVHRPQKKLKSAPSVKAGDNIAKHISEQIGTGRWPSSCKSVSMPCRGIARYSHAANQPVIGHSLLAFCMDSAHERLSFNAPQNLPPMYSLTSEAILGINQQNQILSNAQAYSGLLPSRNSDTFLNPQSHIGGGSNPMLTSYASLAATLSSLNQSPFQLHSSVSLPYPNSSLAHRFSGTDDADAILKLIMTQRQPTHFHQPWSGPTQPSLTSMSIQQLLSSQYAALGDSNLFLQGLANEPNFPLRQNELSDRLMGPAAMAHQREGPNPSIRQYAGALSQLLADDAASRRRRSIPSQSIEATRVAKVPQVASTRVAHDTAETKHDSGVDIDVDVPMDLPFVIGLSEDKLILNDHQVLLRQQIEVFRATKDDVSTHTRGRTKPIKLHQVGIRCRHCAHLPITVRGRGSVYFPSQLMGIYQVAQNMAKLHFLGGACSQIPPEMIQRFQKAKDTVNSGVGRVYWTEAAKKVGLLDTSDNCIRFVRDLQTEENKGATP